MLPIAMNTADPIKAVPPLRRAALRGWPAAPAILDPEVVSQILGAGRRMSAPDALAARERQVLELMAEGRADTVIAARLGLSNASVEKYVTSIFGKLGLPPSETDRRRVLAVLRYLGP